MEPYHIILADDHSLFRQGIKRILEEQEGLRIVGEAGDGIGLLKLLNHQTPHLVIVDISMPGMRGIEATREIRTLHPKVKVLVLTMHRDLAYLEHAVAAGASGFLLKEDADEELLSAVRAIRQGKVYVSPLLKEEMAENLFRPAAKGAGEGWAEPLTTREKEVLKLIAEGKTSREIAGLFSISFRTVQHHRANLMHKLNLTTTAELVKYAIREGYTQT